MKEFEEALRTYLDKVTATDSALAAKYQLSGKTIGGCARYIINEMEKEAQQARQGRSCVALAKTDAEIYGMAVHYFDEDSIKECTEETKTKVSIAAPPKSSRSELTIVKKPSGEILEGQLSLFD